MKKLIYVIPVTILCIILLSDIKVNAVTGSSGSLNHPNGYIIFLQDNMYRIEWVWFHFNGYRFDDPSDSRYSWFYNGVQETDGLNSFSSLDSCINYANNHINDYNYASWASDDSVKPLIHGDYTRIIYNVPYRGASYPDGQPTPTPSPTPTPTPEPTWYGTMWDTLADELGQPEFWFGEWFIDIIDQVFNNDDDEPTQGPSGLSHSTHIKQVTPAPTPTPIPYSTITVPRTDIINNTTVYETQYVYTSSSGDTIIATSPPTNTPSENPSGGGSGGGSDYNPIDPYSIPEVSWFTSAEIGDTSYDGIDSIMQGFDSIDTIGSEYTDGMSVVEDSMGTLPTSWILLIGIAAALPLIAGIISRFLS